jgi:hypothetical protein
MKSELQQTGKTWVLFVEKVPLQVFSSIPAESGVAFFARLRLIGVIRKKPQVKEPCGLMGDANA